MGDPLSLAVVGGGAAGFFAAIAAAEGAPGTQVTVLEKTVEFLAKVRISGGGRCNVTHACWEPREFSQRYPRGAEALIGPLHRFSPAETVAWFAEHGVTLKTEADGRMFPVTDSSQTVIDALVQAARVAGVKLRKSVPVMAIRREGGKFAVQLGNGETLMVDRVLLATGGCRAVAAGALAVALGHTLAAPVPSLFAMHLEPGWLGELPGIAVDPVAVSVPGTGLAEKGPMLITHAGVSGPAVLRLSAWGARILHERAYRFPLHVDWVPEFSPVEAFSEKRKQEGTKRLVKTPIGRLPGRLWEAMIGAAGITAETRWCELSRPAREKLAGLLKQTVLTVTGKTLNKDEFVTCGGVPLREVDCRTMESRVCPGLFFAGELLDLDGVTGGFNFQAAWTTGWLAGRAAAGLSTKRG